MSKRARCTVRQVLDTIFVGKGSNHGTELQVLTANLGENTSETGEDVD